MFMHYSSGAKKASVLIINLKTFHIFTLKGTFEPIPRIVTKRYPVFLLFYSNLRITKTG
jgi:hypothetical protein